MKPYLGLYYKRNQVVEAIARILQRGSTKLDSDLYSRVKRLLELDRAKTHFAFYSADMPGRGYENRFSEFELLLAPYGLATHGAWVAAKHRGRSPAAPSA